MSVPRHEFDHQPAWQVVEWYRSGEVSPSEYVGHCLERIESIEPTLNSFITVLAESAMDEARKADDAFVRGEAGGLLPGIPVGLKDIIAMKGVLTTAGSAAWADYRPAEDATVTRLLRENGAIILGKNNVPEFCSHPRNANPLWGETVNPYDFARVPGASSGGSAAAVAAGLIPLSVGSDGGGSTRIPAAQCGVVGVQPTRSIVSSHGQLGGGPHSSLGPIARDVRDAALMLDAIAGYDHLDSSGLSRVPKGPFLASLDLGVEGMRAVWSGDLGHVTVKDDRLVELGRRAAMLLRDGGATVDEDPIHLPYSFDTFTAFLLGRSMFANTPKTPLETPEALARLAAADPEMLSPHLRPGARKPVTLEQYESAIRERNRLQRNFDSLFDTYDLILTPTMAEYAPLIPGEWRDPYVLPDNGTTFTGMVNLTDTCAVTVPCGYVDGMPVGVQVVGPAHAEAKVLRACRVIEQALGSALEAPRRAMLERLSAVGAGVRQAV